MGEQQKVIERLKKLLVLAERGATEGERASAMARAQEIAVKYAIDLATVNRGDEERPINYIAITYKMTFPDDTWKSIVAQACAALYACVYVIHSTQENDGAEGEGYAYGRPTSLPLVRLFYEYLINEVKRQNRERVAGRGFDKKQRLTFRRSFRLACAMTLQKRINEKIEHMRQHGVSDGESSSRAMVVASWYDQETAAINERLAPQMRQATLRTHSKSDAAGVVAGVEAGRDISLHDQIGGKENGEGTNRLDAQARLSREGH